MRFVVGVDVGGRRDYTAIVIIGYDELREHPIYTATYLHRFPLGTSSVAAVDHLVTLVKTYPLREDVTVVVDATGAGGPILDLLARAGLDPIGIKIHGGQSVSRDDFDGCYRVPKRDLVGVVDYLLPQVPEPVRLEIPGRLPQSKILLAELEAFRAKITLDTGHAAFEAWRERDHDDYVLALACAAWVAERHHGVPVFAGQFFQHHISRSQLMPEGGRSIVRGWRVREPVACVWMQMAGSQQLRILYEHPPVAGQDLTALAQAAAAVRGMLYPNHHVIDIVDDAGPDPAALGGRGPAWPLRSGLMLVQGERNRELSHKVLRKHLTTIKGNVYGFCVDRGASGTIRALREAYRYQQRHGQPVSEPEVNLSLYLMDALLTSLTHPMLTMSANERRSMMGPRVLVPE